MQATTLSSDSNIIENRYALISQLPFDGKFETHRAIDRDTGEDVTVRFLRGSLAGWSERGIEFERLARKLVLLSHPCVVPTLDFGYHEGVPYLIHEQQEERTLEQVLLAKAAFPMTEAIKCMASIIEAIEFAHSQGIVHAGLSLRTVGILASGSPRVHDLGLAALADMLSPSRVPWASSQLQRGTDGDFEAIEAIARQVLMRAPLGGSEIHALPSFAVAPRQRGTPPPAPPADLPQHPAPKIRSGLHTKKAAPELAATPVRQSRAAEVVLASVPDAITSVRIREASVSVFDMRPKSVLKESFDELLAFFSGFLDRPGKLPAAVADDLDDDALSFSVPRRVALPGVPHGVSPNVIIGGTIAIAVMLALLLSAGAPAPILASKTALDTITIMATPEAPSGAPGKASR